MAEIKLCGLCEGIGCLLGRYANDFNSQLDYVVGIRPAPNQKKLTKTDVSNYLIKSRSFMGHCPVEGSGKTAMGEAIARAEKVMADMPEDPASSS